VSTAEANKTFTPDDLLTMEDGNRYELVDGKLMEMEMSTWSSYVAGVLFRLLANHCVEKNLGWVFPEGTSFQCFADDPGKVRKPDSAFIQLSRLSAEQARREGHSTVAPDLAVEVLSPRDVAYDVDRKVEEYLAAGVPVIWVINPDTCTVKIFKAENQVVMLHQDDELTDDTLLPGFRCTVRELFLPPGETK